MSEEDDICGGCGEAGNCSKASGPWARAWWACEECEQWYHSSCCGLTQPQVRALQKAIDAGSDDDGPSWFCDSCDAAGKKNAALSKYYAAVPAAKPAKSAKQDSSAGSAWKWGTDEESEMKRQFRNYLEDMRE